MSNLKRERSAWRVMIRRCTEPKFKDWNRYGGAGIVVCPQWKNSFSQFLADMGPAPTLSHWLGRLDVKGNYEPGNCLWTMCKPQQHRRAWSQRVMLQGKMVMAVEVAEMPGLPTRNSVLRRAENGFDLEQHRGTPKLYKNSMRLQFNGESWTLPELARRYGVPIGKLRDRVKAGWPLAIALSTAPLPRRKPAAEAPPIP